MWAVGYAFSVTHYKGTMTLRKQLEDKQKVPSAMTNIKMHFGAMENALTVPQIFNTK